MERIRPRNTPDLGPEPSSQLAELVEALVRKAAEEKFGLAGFLAKAEPYCMIHFGTVKETGVELAGIYRIVADIVEKKTLAGKVKMIRLERPS